MFLFDESLSNLDSKMRARKHTEITKLHQRLQATMVYVTHKPVNLFVAGFLGSPPMNLVSGKLKHKSRFCEIEGGTIDVAK